MAWYIISLILWSIGVEGMAGAVPCLRTKQNNSKHARLQFHAEFILGVTICEIIEKLANNRVIGLNFLFLKVYFCRVLGYLQ